MDNMMAFLQRLKELLPAFAIAENEQLAKHTSFRIGGPAEVMVFPRTAKELSEILESPRAKALKDGFSRRCPTEELCRRCGYATRFTK